MAIWFKSFTFNPLSWLFRLTTVFACVKRHGLLTWRQRSVLLWFVTAGHVTGKHENDHEDLRKVERTGRKFNNSLHTFPASFGASFEDKSRLYQMSFLLDDVWPARENGLLQNHLDVRTLPTFLRTTSRRHLISDRPHRVFVRHFKICVFNRKNRDSGPPPKPTS